MVAGSVPTVAHVLDQTAPISFFITTVCTVLILTGFLYPPQEPIQRMQKSTACRGYWHFVCFSTPYIEQAEEKSLRTNEEFYQALIENVSDCICVINVDRTIRYMNPFAESMLGYKPRQLIGKFIIDFVHPDDLQKVTNTFNKVMQDKSSVQTEEIRMKHTDGSWRIVEWICKNLLNTPAVAGFICNYRDITECKQIEMQLQKIEETYRMIIQNVNEIVYAVKFIEENPFEGIVQMVGDQVKNIIGYESNEFMEDPGLWLRLIHPDDLPVVVEDTQKLIEHREKVTRRYRIRHKNTGQYCWIEDKVVPKFDDTGKLVNIVGVARDITERIHAERAHSEYERMLSTLLSNLPGYSYRCKNDKDWTLEFISDGAFTLTGYTIDEYLVHRTVTCGEKTHPYDRDRIWNEVQEALEKREPFELVYRIITRSGDEKWVWERGRGIYSSKGELLYLEGLVTDITERIHAERDRERLFNELNSKHEQLQALSRRLVEIQEAERFHIARELHDEIGALLTGLKLKIESSKRSAIDAYTANLSEMETLVNELMGRVREISLDLRPPMLDDIGLVHTLMWHFDRYTNQTNIRVHFKQSEVERKRFTMEVETAIYRIIQEALTNVARHADVSEVTVLLWSDQQTLNLEIEDKGKGFNPEEVLASDKTFGLIGIRERVALLGGRLMINSSPGAGTYLKVEIPMDNSRE